MGMFQKILRKTQSGQSQHLLQPTTVQTFNSFHATSVVPSALFCPHQKCTCNQLASIQPAIDPKCLWNQHRS